MNRFCRVLLVATAAIASVLTGRFVLAERAGSVEPIPRFYAYCVGMGVPGVTPRPVADEAKLLRELGYDGTALPLDANLAANLKILDDTGVKLYMVWASVNVAPGKDAAGTAAISEAIAKLKGRPTTVCVLLEGLAPGDRQGLEPAVKTLRKLGDLAAAAGVRISIYNHVGNWTESLPFVIEVVRKTNHPRVGYNFNLCHWLKVDAGKDYRPLLRESADKLFVVTINGATVGATAWTDGLIRPLDEGNFDNRPLLATLRQIGYRGPVGLMCYGVPGDAREHLTRSMKAWRGLQESRRGAP
jgi:sugar phosphate isomerase/epimerase